MRAPHLLGRDSRSCRRDTGDLSLVLAQHDGHCPSREQPVLAVKRPAHPYKNAIQKPIYYGERYRRLNALAVRTAAEGLVDRLVGRDRVLPGAPRGVGTRHFWPV